MRSSATSHLSACRDSEQILTAYLRERYGPIVELGALALAPARWQRYCDQHLEKGRRVSVTGRIAHDQWQTEDGQRRQRHYVVADNVEFLDARKNGVQVEAQPELEAATA